MMSRGVLMMSRGVLMMSRGVDLTCRGVDQVGTSLGDMLVGPYTDPPDANMAVLTTFRP